MASDVSKGVVKSRWMRCCAGAIIPMHSCLAELVSPKSDTRFDKHSGVTWYP